MRPLLHYFRKRVPATRLSARVRLVRYASDECRVCGVSAHATWGQQASASLSCARRGWQRANDCSQSRVGGGRAVSYRRGGRGNYVPRS